MTSWQARVARIERTKAEQRFNEVRKLANSYLFEFHDAIENLPGSTAARALLVRRALEYLDSLAREAGGDLSLQREVAMAYLKVGNVQGNPRNANLGDTAGALESYRKALAIAESWPPKAWRLNVATSCGARPGKDCRCSRRNESRAGGGGERPPLARDLP
jgi:hypothetical protein